MTKSLKFVASLAIMGWLALPAAHAENRTLIASFTPANVTSVLEELGIRGAIPRRQQTAAGTNVDSITFEVAGTKHIGLLTVCKDARGCLGLELLTLWSDAGKDANRANLNNFNAIYPFGKAYVGPNNTLVFARYAIADGGVTVDNVKANITNFIAASNGFKDYMLNAGKGTEASAAPAGGNEASLHLAGSLSPEAQAIVMSAGQSQGVNSLTLPAAPPSKPAQ